MGNTEKLINRLRELDAALASKQAQVAEFHASLCGEGPEAKAQRTMLHVLEAELLALHKRLLQLEGFLGLEFDDQDGHDQTDFSDVLQGPSAALAIKFSVFNRVGVRQTLSLFMVRYGISGYVCRLSPTEVECLAVAKVDQTEELRAFLGQLATYAMPVASRDDVKDGQGATFFDPRFPLKHAVSTDPEILKYVDTGVETSTWLEEVKRRSSDTSQIADSPASSEAS